jgi:Carboxypeptidase regulatory-like domain
LESSLRPAVRMTSVLFLTGLACLQLRSQTAGSAPDALLGGGPSQVSRGQRIAETKCIDCHVLSRVVEAHHTSAEWQHVVATMMGRGARLEPDEIPALLQYLERFGPSAANTAESTATDRDRQSAASYFDLGHPPKRGEIAGRVTTDQGPARGFRVTAHNLRYKLWYVVFTKEGRYSIPQALPGSYEVSVLQEGYRSSAKSVALEPGNAWSVNLEVSKEPPDPASLTSTTTNYTLPAQPETWWRRPAWSVMVGTSSTIRTVAEPAGERE